MRSSVPCDLWLLKLFRVCGCPELAPVLMWNCWFRDPKLGVLSLEGREGSTSGLQLCALGGSTPQCSYWCSCHNLQVLDAFPDPRQFLCWADASLKEAYGWLNASWENPSTHTSSLVPVRAQESLGVLNHCWAPSTAFSLCCLFGAELPVRTLLNWMDLTAAGTCSELPCTAELTLAAFPCSAAFVLQTLNGCKRRKVAALTCSAHCSQLCSRAELWAGAGFVLVKHLGFPFLSGMWPSPVLAHSDNALEISAFLKCYLISMR